MAFKNKAPFVHKMNSNFLSILWSWANLYSVDSTSYLLDFLAWLGYRLV